MKKAILVFGVVLALALAAFTWFKDINGNWSAKLKGPDGNEFPISYTFKVDGGILTGTVTSEIGTFDISEGKVEGDSLWFIGNIKTMKIKNKGKYFADGDSISLRVGARSTHTTLKRSTEK